MHSGVLTALSPARAHRLWPPSKRGLWPNRSPLKRTHAPLVRHRQLVGILARCCWIYLVKNGLITAPPKAHGFVENIDLAFV